MQRSHILMAIASLLLSETFIFGDILEISPKVTDVTVFPSSAYVKKESTFSLTKGEHTLSVPDLTPDLISDSLQIKLSKSGNVKISDIKIEQTYLQKSGYDKTDKLQARLEQTLSAIKSKNDAISLIVSSNDFLKNTSPFSQNQKISESELKDHAAFLEKTLAENFHRIAKIETDLRELQKEKASIEKELNALKTPDQAKHLLITLSASADIENQSLELTYIVNHAGWKPLYVVDIRSASGKAEWSTFASISQASGEDWTNAVIAISTTKPFSSAAPGPLGGWYIDLYRPPLVQSYAKSAYDQAEMLDRRSMAASMAPEAYTSPTVQQESTSFSFLLPGKNTIPSDNQPHKLFIASAAAETELHYRAVPRLSSSVYMTAVLENPFSFPLLAGDMTLLLDSNVVGMHNSYKTLFPGEEIQLSLGADDSIKADYKQNKKYAKTVSKETHVQYSYSHEIVNGKNKAIKVSIEDHFPISRNDQIKVVLNSPTKEAVKISEEGIITWDIDLKPHEKKVLPMQFTVSYPKKVDVVGLE